MSNPKQKEISIWVMGLKTKKLIKQIKSHVKNEALHKFLLVVNHYLPLFNLSTSPSGICRLFLLFLLLGIFTLENEKKKIPNLQNLDWESVAAFLGFMPWTNFPWEGIFFSFSRLVLSLCHENRKKPLSPIFTPEREQVNSLRKTLSSFCYSSCFYFVWDKVGCIPPWLSSNPMELKTA